LLGLAAEADPGLADWNLGDWRGRPLESIAAEELAAWMSTAEARPHGGESLSQLLARTGAWLDHQPARLNVVVTTAAVVRAAIVVALRAGGDAFWHLDLAPLTASVLTGEGNRWNLRSSGQPLGTVAQLNRTGSLRARG
jgi:broad specificity phosphatase PhoE